MKTIDKLPQHVQKPCGTKPGPDDTSYVANISSGRQCRNWASYAVTIDGTEILVCGQHRRAIQEPTHRLFPGVLTD